MGTVVNIVRGKKTGIFGIQKGQVLVAKTTGNQAMLRPVHDLNARSLLCGARSARTCWGATSQPGWQAPQDLGRYQRPGTRQRMYPRECRLRSS